MHVWYVDAGIEDTPEPVYTHCLVLSYHIPHRIHISRSDRAFLVLANAMKTTAMNQSKQLQYCNNSNNEQVNHAIQTTINISQLPLTKFLFTSLCVEYLKIVKNVLFKYQN